ncbi:MAG: glycosyltransferase [Bradyrhizobium sp.]|uniref:glycosyltransferase family protein n=1 Tax=Bradyrhizobium sp. TaxID=376 RepID=UPI003D0A23D1
MHGKVLLLSQRRISDLVAFCLAYEFEDTFHAVTGAERVDATDFASIEFSRRVYKLVRLASGSPSLAARLAPVPRGNAPLAGDFELFFPIFNNAFELYSLATIPDWRKRCRKAACFISEIWTDLLPEYLLELLSEFDHVFTGLQHCADDVGRITGRPCSYLPLATDVLRFAPAGTDQPRPIEVCNIGRRSQVTHRALLADAARRNSFYYYDTVAASGADLKQRTFRVDDPQEHRLMLATILKHSRYFIANRSHVNNPEFTAGRDEISARFYEGIAAGTIMIGEAPRTAEFKRQFDWPDVVTHLPFDSPNVADILADLNSDPDRLATVRSRNLREAARRHDWLYRIETVFDTLGLKPTEAMQARTERLAQIARQADAGLRTHA